jgi:hypothetical protein
MTDASTAADDAELFLEAARDEDFTDATRRDVQTWMFRVKREMEGRYDYDAVGRERDFEATLAATEGTAAFVVDVSPDGVEVNAFVMDDEGDEALVDEVLRQP